MDSCEAASITVGMKLQQHLISSLSGCIDEEKRTSLLETLQILLEGRNNWRREASQHIAGMVNVVTTLLQFEFSRSGQTWNLGEAVNEGFLEANCDVAGEAPDDESFTNFDMWLNKLCDVTGVIQESKQVLKDCQDATDMTRSQIQQYQSQKQSSLEAIADVSQSISKSISNLSNAAGAVRHYSEKMTREDPTTRVFLTETIGENCFFLSALFIVWLLGPWLKSLRAVVNKYDVDLDKLTKEAQSKLEAAEMTLRFSSPTSLCNTRAFDGDLSETPSLSVGSSRGAHLTDALVKREADVKAIKMAAEGIAKVNRLNLWLLISLFCRKRLLLKI